MISEQRQGTVVHFVANIDGGVWTAVKLLAAQHRPRWKVMLVAVYKGRLRESFARQAEELFDNANLIHRPYVPGIYYLQPVNVQKAVEPFGIDTRTDDNVVYHFHTGPYTSCVYRIPRRKHRAGKWLAWFQGSRGNFRDVHNPKRLIHTAGVRRLLNDDITMVAVSQRSAQDCAQLYGCRESDFRVVYNGTHVQAAAARQQSAEDRPFRVGFVGTVMPIKGWRKVVAAVEKLRREGVNVVCSLVGEGPDFPELQQLGARHPNWLDVRGHIDNPEESVYSSFDVLIVPSDFEGQPLVILEAMSCGIPCICSDVGGNAETIRHDSEGYILQQNSADEIAAYIKQLIDSKGLWTTFSQNCVQRHREMFTVERMAADWEQLYLEGNGE